MVHDHVPQQEQEHQQRANVEALVNEIAIRTVGKITVNEQGGTQAKTDREGVEEECLGGDTRRAPARQHLDPQERDTQALSSRRQRERRAGLLLGYEVEHYEADNAEDAIGHEHWRRGVRVCFRHS